MWRALLLCGVVLLASNSAADVYKCPDSRGKIMYQDQPCTDASSVPLLTTGPTAIPPQVAHPTPRTVLPEPLVSIEPTDDFTAKECMKINDIQGREGRSTKYVVEVDWKVDVSNRCKRPFRIWVRYILYDKGGFELEHDVQPLRVPAGDLGTATGRLRIRPPEKVRPGTQSAASISLQSSE